MEKIVFYSWQSDLPNSTNRGFIENALRKASEKITDDSTVEIEPVIERDTKGVAGSPDISTTILNKIDKATIFVADVSIINKDSNDRSTPNPNVLIELGYAIKNLGWENIILVMNKEYGGPELLPFDLKMRRVIVYSLTTNEKDRTVAKKILEQSFEDQICSIISSLKPTAIVKKPHEELIENIEKQNPKRIRDVQVYMDYLNKFLDEAYPGKYTGQGYDDILIASIGKTLELVTDFANVIEYIAIYNDDVILEKLFNGFKKILDHCNLPIGHSGPSSNADFDFYKFIGNELFTTTVSVLLRNKKIELIKKLLDCRLVIDNDGFFEKASVDFTYIGTLSLPSLDDRDNKLHIPSTKASLINERHNSPSMETLSSFDDYMAADFFLFLKAKEDTNGWLRWYPWSLRYLKELPNFLIEAHSNKNALELIKVLGFPDIETFKKDIIDYTSKLKGSCAPTHYFDIFGKKRIEEIGKYP